MMGNTYMISFMVSLIYAIIRFFEMRIFKKEDSPTIKDIAKQSLMVLISSVLCLMLIKQVSPELSSSAKTVEVFTDVPGF